MTTLLTILVAIILFLLAFACIATMLLFGFLIAFITALTNNL